VKGRVILNQVVDDIKTPPDIDYVSAVMRIDGIQYGACAEIKDLKSLEGFYISLRRTFLRKKI